MIKYFFFALSLYLYIGGNFAQASLGEDPVSSEEIQVTGEFAPKKTRAQRMKELRAKLEKQNEELIRRQIRQIRLQQEMDLTKKLQVIMQQAQTQLEEL